MSSSNRAMRREAQRNAPRVDPAQLAALMQGQGPPVQQVVQQMAPMNDAQVLGLMAAEVWAGSVEPINPEEASRIAEEMFWHSYLAIEEKFKPRMIARSIHKEIARRKQTGEPPLTAADCGMPVEEFDKIARPYQQTGPILIAD